ncbi:aspartate/glutamate racemase family protein [Nocardioides acrostichi]|uniref:Aspartate/glutamate racemase family protein n=1 Tax=Nocardioides acrostichi TaxID=2784339 RepID=A0A930UZS7_9ACTN|nr:aspartate/glutamate racemase family protein [Nocardioides acrostichi]MBF4161251.1 aspartate/glutamate racemase family protein [Nocardioides acrostichi]
MRILVVNPNTTESMTALIEQSARAAVGPGVCVDAVNPVSGPESIESHYDDALATPGVLAVIVEGATRGYDGFVIACFGDPGLLAARELVEAPVVGIAEAALRTAGYLGRTFSVVTTLSRTLGHSREIAYRYGVASLVGGMHACEIPVVDLETDPTARAAILAACEHALSVDGSDAIVLGCAGMADLARDLSRELCVPVVDGVAAATAEVEKLVRLGLKTGKRDEFAPPPPKRVYAAATTR